ncbi:MAG: hypothetical protein DMG33_17930 [Acidobacteria bacterium]|nr:MAG: hypothetical protein DMG33_17930 [Acidobacteriota bacterium]
MGEQQSQLPGDVRPKTKLTKFREFQRIYLQIARRNWPALVALAALSLFAGFETARLETAYAKQQNPQSSAGAFFAASPAHLSGRSSDRGRGAEVDELSLLTPQLQAERLLERAIDRSESSLEQIHQRLDGWRGHFQETDRLFDLVAEAMNSKDLRVRDAAVEIDLAANNLNKTPQSIMQLMKVVHTDSVSRSLALWRLGALGSRGVQPETIFATLLRYAHHRNEDTRYWAVEGLAMLATDATIDSLLNILRSDPSPRIRQRAACSLAESGLLTQEQRFAAVPDLLNLLDDDALDSATRGWVYGALRGITGEPLGNDASGWREWWAERDRHPKKSYATADLLHA